MVTMFLVDQFQFAPDDDWNFVFEQHADAHTLTAHCERPVLYGRGGSWWGGD